MIGEISEADIGLLKYVWIICSACIAYVCNFLGLELEAMLAYGILLLVDYFLGIFRVIVMKEVVSSHKMLAGILSKASLWIIPFILALVFKIIPIENLRALIVMFLYMFVLSELYSILNNIRTIKTQKKKLPEIDIFNIIATMIRNKIISLADRFKMTDNSEDKDDDIRH